MENLVNKKTLGLGGMVIICACVYSNLGNNSFYVSANHNKKTVICADNINDKKDNCDLIGFLGPKASVIGSTSGLTSTIAVQIVSVV